MRKTVCTLGAIAGSLALLASPAAAHVSPDKDEVPAESFNNVTLSVGHGCEESPTRELRIQIPESLTNVTPQIHPGWDIEVVTEELDEPIQSEGGEEITERTSEVVFTAQQGNELPDGFRDTFTLGFRTGDTPGEYLFFKTIQSCEEGEHRWIEEWVEGVTEGEEPEEPAPALLVTEAEAEEEGGGGEDDEAEEEEAAEEAAPATEETAAADDDSDDSDSSTGLAIAGLIAGLLGLAAGGFALFRTRSS